MLAWIRQGVYAGVAIMGLGDGTYAIFHGRPEGGLVSIVLGAIALADVLAWKSVPKLGSARVALNAIDLFGVLMGYWAVKSAFDQDLLRCLYACAGYIAACAAYWVLIVKFDSALWETIHDAWHITKSDAALYWKIFCAVDCILALLIYLVRQNLINWYHTAILLFIYLLGYLAIGPGKVIWVRVRSALTRTRDTRSES